MAGIDNLIEQQIDEIKVHVARLDDADYAEIQQICALLKKRVEVLDSWAQSAEEKE